MTIIRLTGLASLCVVVFIGGDCFAQSEPGILVFSKTSGYRHASIEPGKAALQRLGKENGMKVDTTEDAGRFTTDGLAAYDAIVFLNTTLDVLDEQQQGALTQFVRSGGGYVGIHSAADTEYDWPWYGALVGGYFNGHPNNPNVRNGVISVVDASHVSTVDLPSPWTREDEWYDYKSMNPEVNVLLSVDEHSYKKAEENPSDEPHPIAWFHEYDGGRAFYTGLGHTSASFSEPLYLKHLLGGIRYAIGSHEGSH